MGPDACPSASKVFLKISALEDVNVFPLNVGFFLPFIVPLDVSNLFIMEASRPPVEELWCTVYSRGVCPKKSMPQYKWRKQISNFTPNFIPPPKEGEVTENNSSGSDGAQGTNEVSYDVFLSMEGRLTAENPYKEEIMNTPLQLPSERKHLHLRFLWYLLQFPAHGRSWRGRRRQRADLGRSGPRIRSKSIR